MQGKIKDSILQVETGDVYQPVRLTYFIHDPQKLISTLDQLKCLEQDSSHTVWTWYWKNECADLRFDSANISQETNHTIRLGTLNIKGNQLFIHLPSFKRACLAASFFHRILNQNICVIQHADFINKLFTKNESLPRKLNNLFNDVDLSTASNARVAIYKQVENQCQSMLSTEEALNMITDVLNNEKKWELPHVERYSFEFSTEENPQVIFMAFYLFMRSRELVLLNRAAGKFSYQLADAANETIEHTFGYHPENKETSPIFLRAQALFRGYIQHQSINIFC